MHKISRESGFNIALDIFYILLFICFFLVRIIVSDFWEKIQSKTTNNMLFRVIIIIVVIQYYFIKFKIITQSQPVSDN